MSEQIPNCINYELCNNTALTASGFCMTCSSWLKCGALSIVDSTGNCGVCMNPSQRKVVFPAGCGHSFCVACSRTTLIIHGSRYHLSPVPYGCPPCPKGCDNPTQGKQCMCQEYDAVQEAWAQSNTGAYNRWNDDQNTPRDGSIIYGKWCCPLCKKKYTR